MWIRDRRNSGGSRRQSAALSGRPPAVRLTARAQKRGHHRSDGPFFGSMSASIRRLAAPAGFPLPHAATGLPVRLPPYKVWERPLPRSRSCGVSPIHISSQNDFFPLHSICMEKSAYHSACRCAKSQREVVSGSTKQKNCTSTGTANKPYDTCLNHKQLHPPWTGEASCASYTGRYSDSGIQRGSRLPRA